MTDSLLTVHKRRMKQMGWDIEQPESLNGGGKYVSKPGIYHMLITAVNENPVGEDEKPLDGTEVSVIVLGGTNPDQEGKQLDVLFWKPKERDDMASKRQTCFAIATCLIGHHQPGEKVKVNPQDTVGRQVVMKLSPKRMKNKQTGEYEDTKFMDLHYSDIWHVDNTEVKKNNVPLHQESLAAIPAVLRKPVTDVAAATAAPSVSPAALVTGTRSTMAATSVADL